VKGELIHLGDTTVRFLVEGADSGESAAVFEVGISARGKMPAPHSHDTFEETIYGLEGVSTWTVEDAADPGGTQASGDGAGLWLRPSGLAVVRNQPRPCFA
jgi:hypothetical protein